MHTLNSKIFMHSLLKKIHFIKRGKIQKKSINEYHKKLVIIHYDLAKFSKIPQK